MSAAAPIDPWLLERLACPRDRAPLALEGNALVCGKGHRYPVIEGVPVLLRDDVRQTIGIAEASVRAAKEGRGSNGSKELYLDTLGITDTQREGVARLAKENPPIDPVVSYLVAATSGLMYKDLVGSLDSYPIPDLRLPTGHGESFLDVGCNWGRWSVAAAQKGYRVIGVDPSLGAVLAAQRVARQLGVTAHFVVGDGRFLPFREQSFQNAFSYSVLQHMSREDVRAALEEMRRVLIEGGRALVQMPNRLGIRSLYHQARRRFREPQGFEVRYWSLAELERTFQDTFGRAKVSVDCFFGLGLQYSDRAWMNPSKRMLLSASETLRRASTRMPPLRHVADSVYLHAINTLRR